MKGLYKKQVSMRRITIILAVCFSFSAVLGQTVLYVSPHGSSDGSSWSETIDLEKAIKKASSLLDAQLWLVSGHYYPTQTLVVPSGVSLYGGFRGTESRISERNYSVNKTIIDGQYKFRIFHLGESSLLNGLKIYRGYAKDDSLSDGGGVFMLPESRIEYCEFEDNRAERFGGAICSQGIAYVYQCLVIRNKAKKDGSAIYGDKMTMRNTTITENEIFTCPAQTPSETRKTICSGEFAEFTILDEPGSYLWSDGSSEKTLRTGILQKDTVLTARFTTEDQSCASFFSFHVHVKPLPALLIKTSVSLANAGDKCVFTAEALPRGGRYLWDDLTSSRDSFLLTSMPVSGDLLFSCTYEYDGCKVSAQGEIKNSYCTPPMAPTMLNAEMTGLCAGDSTRLRPNGGAKNSGKWYLYKDSCGGILLDSSSSVSPVFLVKPNTSTTYYIRAEGCGVQTSCVEQKINLSPLPDVINGPDTLCLLSQGSYQNNTPGGVWGTGTSLVATIHTTTGILNTIQAGSLRVFYTLNSTGCSRSKQVSVLPAPGDIFGEFSLCQGVERTFSSTPPGGAWRVTPSEIATLKNMSIGLIKASTTHTGDGLLMYAHPLTGCERSVKISVLRQPAKTVGPGTICQYDSTDLLNASQGGVWAVYPNTLASVDLLGRMKTFSAGNAILTYRLGQCIDSLPIKILPQLDAISGATHLCEEGLTTAFVSGNSGGIWSASPASVAKIDSLTGVLTGIKSGFYTLTYLAPNGCQKMVKGEVKPIPGPIRGDSLLGIGQTTYLYNDSSSGSWSSGNTDVAAIGASDGMVVGKKAGKVKMKYQFPIPNTCYVNHSMIVEACASITLSSSEYSDHQEVCYQGLIDDVQYSLKGATITEIAWFDEQNNPILFPKGLSYDSLNHTLRGIPGQSGEFHYIISSKNHFPGCPATFVRGQLLVYDSVTGGIIKDNQIICSGSSPIEFSSLISGQGGEPFSGSYQWESSFDGTTFSPIALANSESYNDLSNLTQLKFYRRRFIDPRCASAYSNIVQVQVNSLPEKPIATVLENTRCSGVPNGRIELLNAQAGNLYALGSGFFYATTFFEQLAAGSYTLRVKDANACQNSSVLTVSNSNAGAPIIDRVNVSPKDSICENYMGAVTLTPVYHNAGTSPLFQWSTAATSEVLILGSVTRSEDYVLKISNQETGCDGLFTQRITVMPEVHIMQNISPKTVCKDAVPPSLDLVVTQEGSGRSYQWQQSSNGGTSFVDIAGQNNPSYNVPTILASSLYYRCLVKTKANICPDIYSAVAQVQVLPTPVLTNVLHDTICGIGSATLRANTQEARELQWFDVANGGSPIYIADTSNPYMSPPLSITTSYWVRAYNGYCSSTPRQEIKAVVLPEHSLQVNSGAQDQEICSGSYMNTITLAYNAGSTDASLTFTPKMPSGVNVSKGSGLLTISGQPSDTGSFSWQVRTIGNRCTSKTRTGILKINPLPLVKINPSKDTLCNGDDMVLMASGAVSYQWLTPFISSNPSQLINPNVNTVYSVEGSSDKGCKQKVSHTVYVKNPPKFIEPTDGTDKQTVCHRMALKEIRYGLSNAGSVAWLKNGLPLTPPTWITLSYNGGVVTINGTAEESGTFNYVLSSVGHSTACAASTATGTLIVYDSIKGGRIAADQSICYNESPAAFTNIFSATGGHPTNHNYQWEISISGDTNTEGAFSNIAMATNETYNESTNLTATRYYRRAILDAFCNAHVHSNALKVTVHTLPVVPTYSVAVNTACGTVKNGQITVTSPLGADFEYSIDGSNYQTSPVFTQLGQGTYSLIVRSKSRLCTNQTPVFVGSTVITPLVNFTVNPNDSLCSSYSGPLTITANVSNGGSNPSYLWSTGATTKDLMLPSPPATSASYTLTVTDQTTACSGISSQIIVIMPAINIIQHPHDSTLCVGASNFSLSVETFQQGSGRIFQWQKSTHVGGPFTDVSADNGSATNSFLRISSLSALEEYYRCKVSTGAGICPPATSQTAHLRVLAIPSIASVILDSICGSGTTQLKANASLSTDTIRWYADIAAATPLAYTLSGLPFTTPALSSTTTYYACAYNGYCAASSRTPVQASVLPLHSITLTGGPTSQSICLGAPMAPINHSYNSPITGSLIWTPVAPGGLSIANANTISGTPTGIGTYTWTYTTKGNKCPEKTSSGSITITALPATPVVSGNLSACDSVLLTASNSGPGTIYYQEMNAAGTSTLSAFASLYVKTGGTHYFRVYSAEGCWGQAGSTTVSILSKPMITGQPNTNDKTPSFAALTVMASGSAPLTYQWFLNTNNSHVGGTSILGATSNTYSPSNIQYGDAYYYCQVSNSCGTVFSNVSGKHTVIPPPSPIVWQRCPNPLRLASGTSTFTADGIVNTNGNYTVSVSFELSHDPSFTTDVRSFPANPATVNNKSAQDVFATLSGLDTEGIWYYRIKAVNGLSVYSNVRLVYNNFSMLTNEEKIIDGKLFVSDHEGNIYSTVAIGTQTWLAENMRCTTRPNGAPILNINGGASVSEPYYTKPPNDCYGVLYNWSAAIDTNVAVDDFINLSDPRRGICPQGWHLPTDDQWCTLESFLDPLLICLSPGYRGDIASRLSAKTDLWRTHNVPNTPGNYENNIHQNSTGFSALPATSYVNKLWDDSKTADFWSVSDGSSVAYAISRTLYFDNVGVYRSGSPKVAAMSIRCIKD